MAKLLLVLLLVSICSHSLAKHHHAKAVSAASRSTTNTEPKATPEESSSTQSSSEGSSSEGGQQSSSSEGKAGEAIKTLLQEKITQKFKEAANEVKGVLVKQLGDSLKSAHDVFNPPKTSGAEGKKVASTSTTKVQAGKAANKYHLRTHGQTVLTVPTDAKEVEDSIDQ